MDNDRIRRDIESKRTHFVVLGVSLVFPILSALLMAGLGRLLPWLVIVMVVGAIPLFGLYIRVGRRTMRPVLRLIKRSADEDPPSRRDVRQCFAIMDTFPFKDALWSIGLWMCGLAILVLFVWYFAGMTNWQIVIVASLGVIAVIAHTLLSYHVNLHAMGQARLVVESRVPSGSALAERTGDLSRRMLFAFGIVVVLVWSVTSVIWHSWVREAAAERILAENQGAFQTVGRRLERAMAAAPGAKPEQDLRKADPSHRLLSDLLLTDRSGRMLAGRRKIDKIDADWLRRIIDEGTEDWLQMRAPFLYHHLAVSGGSHLFWIGDLSRVEQASSGPAGMVVLGGLLMVIIGLVLASSVVWSGLKPLQSLSVRVRRLARGELEQGVMVSGDGEVAALARAIEEFVGLVRRLREASRQAAGGIDEHHGRLIDRLENIRQDIDHRSEIAERTASSVVEMRSSIQSISEQVDSLRQAATDCSSSLFEIEQSVNEVSSAADNLQKMVDENASAISQIARSMGEVSGNVEELARRAEEADASISAMGLAIKQVEDNTSETHRLSEEVSEIALLGVNSVSETIDGINEIQNATDETREVINRLGAQMEAVGKILTVISDVAQQTNLLALNAAIIAAAAGEHGKGFAVVADEIKDLANRTATSTKEITGLIRSVQADSRRAVDAIERGSGSVRRGVELANNASKALQTILSSVGDVGRMANEINRSTAEHSRLAGVISRTMADMSKMLHEIRRAMSEQTKGGERINRVSEQLRDDARFVFRSAKEQAQAVGGVNRNMERIAEMVGFVSKAIAEQTQGVGHVARVAEEVRDDFMKATAQVADAEEIANRIGRVAREMRELSDGPQGGGEQ